MNIDSTFNSLRRAAQAFRIERRGHVVDLETGELDATRWVVWQGAKVVSRKAFKTERDAQKFIARVLEENA